MCTAVHIRDVSPNTAVSSHAPDQNIGSLASGKLGIAIRMKVKAVYAAIDNSRAGPAWYSASLERPMGILIAFAPFIVFVIVNRTIGTLPGLSLAAITSAILIVRDAMNKGRRVKILEIGTLLLFAGLAVYAKVVEPSWSVIAVRLRVDSGLLIVVLVTMILQRPFTLQYAQERTPRDEWTKPGFVRTSYIITAVWAAAFALMVVAEFSLLYVPQTPQWLGIGVTVAAIYGAIQFTSWYPENLRRRAVPTTRA